MASFELKPLPADFATTVAALHRVAEELVAPARKPDNEIALEAAPGGFGTPEFAYDGARRRVRVEAAELVQEIDGVERRVPLTSLAEAATAVAELLPAGIELSAEPLRIDPAAALALGDFYGFGSELLEHLIARAGEADAATPPHLWPEHFDIAIELGSEAAGSRANYGLSPGDKDHPEPYLYVGPWGSDVNGDLWGATGFAGAELGYAELLASPDQRAAALEFFTTRREALATNARSAE